MVFLWAIIKPLAYLSLPAIFLQSIASASPTGRYYVRVGVYVLNLTLAGVWAACVAAGMSLVGRRYDVNWAVARTFYFLAGRSLGIEVEVEGEEHLLTRPAVFMCNHQTMVDVLVLGRLMPQKTSIMAKRELLWSPLGLFMTLSGSVFVDRGNNANAVRSMHVAGEGMKKRSTSLWMYPEGTRTSQEEPNMIKLKKGGFYLAIQSGLPIVPVITENYWRLYHPCVFEPGKVKVRVLPPISTEGLTSSDVAELAARVRDQMLQTLREISVRVPSREQPSESEDQTPTPAVIEPSLPSSASISSMSGTLPSIGTDEGGNGGDSESHSVSGSDISLKRESSGPGTETEEDMVIIERPT